jgi:hypothetical protein
MAVLLIGLVKSSAIVWRLRSSASSLIVRNGTMKSRYTPMFPYAGAISA